MDLISLYVLGFGMGAIIALIITMFIGSVILKKSNEMGNSTGDFDDFATSPLNYYNKNKLNMFTRDITGLKYGNHTAFDAMKIMKDQYFK